MSKNEIIQSIKGGLIVSCQALPGEPLYNGENSIMPLMAKAAQIAGAAAIRTNGVMDVDKIKEKTGMPIIGLIKKNYEGYEPFITSTMNEVDQLVNSKADIIAIDCTDRERFNGITVREFIRLVKKKYEDIILMADISTYEEGVIAYEEGVDIIGTTLSGYTSYSERLKGPDFELVKKLAANLDIPIIAEGRIHYPEDAKKMLDLGAYAVVVGGAITRPLEIASRFVEVMNCKK